MGIILSRFKTKVSTKEKLQKIQEEIVSLAEYKEHTEQRRKKLVGSFIAYSIFLYLLAAAVYYFYYLPPSFEERLLYATPFLGTIFLIYFIKTLLSWYYRWKVRRNENKLETLKMKKEEIMDQVMETETYKVAKDILETFAEPIRKPSMTLKPPLHTPVVSGHRMPMSQSGEVRRRIVSPQPPQSFGPRPPPAPIRSSGLSSSFSYARPPMTPQNMARPPRPDGGPPMHPSNNSWGDPPPGPPMPRPILPRERGMLDRFVEYLVGDGPANRYALVCRQCESHNGMALKEEFNYIAFRCAYCFYWNPARKQKPAPPRLESHMRGLEMSRKVLEKEETSSEEEEDEESESDSCSTSNPSSDDGLNAEGKHLTNASHYRHNNDQATKAEKTSEDTSSALKEMQSASDPTKSDCEESSTLPPVTETQNDSPPKVAETNTDKTNDSHEAL